MRLVFAPIFGLILSTAALFAQGTPENLRIYPSQVTQTEPVLAASPVNPQLLFASAVTLNTQNGFKSEGVYVSSDGGQQWSGSDTCTGQLLVNHGGDPGVAITPNGRLVLTHIGAVFTGLYSHYSTDLGASWANAYTISSVQPEDKGGITMDGDPASPYYGRVYAGWVNFTSPFPVSSAYSTDGGESWSAPAPVNSPPPGRCSGGSLASGPGGRVYLTWAVVNPVAPFAEDFAGFAVSSDGGVSWSVSQQIFDMSGINGSLPSKGNIRVNGLPRVAVDNSGGPRSGWIYIVTGEKNLAPAGSDPDIILHRSSDGGVSWSGGIRVNRDPLNNGKIQFFPALAVDQGGGVNVLFYDDRHTAGDSSEVWLARSSDGGETWEERVISDHRFQPKPILGGSSNYQGDHIALLAAGNRLHAAWMDDAAGIYQVWLAGIDIPPTALAPSAGGLPEAAQLLQNYPNPFNPETQISYQIENASYVQLTVFNLHGERVINLIDEFQPAGWHHVELDGSELTSGVYFYRLRLNQQNSIVKKMVLLR